MNKTIRNILIIVAIILAVSVIIVLCFGRKKGTQSSKLNDINNVEDLEEVINTVYSNLEPNLLPKLETMHIETSQTDTVTMLTGLENGNDLEFLVISQPLMSSQAYAFVLAKVKDGIDANEVAKKMSEQVDTRRWICVEAEKLYATNSGNIVCLIMADSEQAQAVYDSFKAQAGSIGKEYEKTAVQEELPPDMY